MTFRFDPKDKLIVVTTRIWGVERDVVARLALDTGATHSLLNAHLLELVGYDPASGQERLQITTGSGVEFVPRIRVRRISALGLDRRNFPVVCHTLPPSASVDGLLGVDFFHRCRLSIDFASGALGVRRPVRRR